MLSQFPLWDFFECNGGVGRGVKGGQGPLSQFPLWDFFECNGLERYADDLQALGYDSQFPLWDFFECNTMRNPISCPMVINHATLNSLCGISLNVTRCRFGCFSGNWRGKSAGHTAYPASKTVLIKIRTLFKFISVKPSPTHPHTFHRGLPRGRKPSAMRRT